MADYKKGNYGEISFYHGADYGLDPNYGNPIGHNVFFSNIGTAVNPQTANQIKAVSDALNTGAKTVEVQMTFAEIEKAIPNQHLEEINRLRKITGAELTLHGPMIEPTGFNPQAGAWSDSQRVQAERQMWNAFERAHKVDPTGNIVVTFHSSQTLPEPRTKIVNEKGEIVSSSLFVIDERTGAGGQLPLPKKDYLFNEQYNVDEELKRFNDERWKGELSNLNIEVSRAREAFREGREENELLKGINRSELYAMSDTEKGKKYLNSLPKEVRRVADEIISNVNYGKIFVDDSYTKLQNLYNQAYDAAEKVKDKETIGKLDEFRDEVAKDLKDYRNDKSKVIELGKAVSKGVKLLGSINAPQSLQPIEKFAIDKASETFANVAFKGFKKFGETAPIVSIENPPVGMGLTRAEELQKLIKETRNKFINKAKEDGISESEAEKQAEKLIGATWDVGHINMLRQYGFKEEHLKEQTKTIAPYIKHVHLSDNFGMAHSELPMGYGNVPMKAHEELIKKYGKQVEKIKRIIEAGDWVTQFGGLSAIPQTVSFYGSPLYPMKMGPYWNQVGGLSGGYFAGQGAILPDVNFRTYGTSFMSLPVELGGQMQGGRDRLSGTPME